METITQEKFNTIYKRAMHCGKFQDEYGIVDSDAIDRWMIKKFAVNAVQYPLAEMRKNCGWCRKKWQDIEKYNQEGIWQCPDCGKEIEWGT